MKIKKPYLNVLKYNEKKLLYLKTYLTISSSYKRKFLFILYTITPSLFYRIEIRAKFFFSTETKTNLIPYYD